MKPIRLATFVICLACIAARGQVSQSADCSLQIDKALEVTGVKDVTPQAHNGCRPRKRRRV